MIVRKLISELSKYPPDSLVAIHRGVDRVDFLKSSTLPFGLVMIQTYIEAEPADELEQQRPIINK